jgi:1,4-alpha-glucan branching enzyme
MPGDAWQRFANLRLLFGNQFLQPAKKLGFMGGEFGQWREWSHDSSLDWHLLDHPLHRGVQRWVRDLNTLYRGEPALYSKDCSPEGFEWIDCNDAEGSTTSFLRRGGADDATIVVACNYTPVPRHDYRLGVPHGGYWQEILNGDAPLYGGSGQGNSGGVDAVAVPVHGRPWSLRITLPPLAIVVFRG